MIEIISNIYVNAEYLDDLYPNPNGTVSAEWKNNENEVVLEVGKEEFSYYVNIVDVERTYNNNKQYDDENIDMFIKCISEI